MSVRVRPSPHKFNSHGKGYFVYLAHLVERKTGNFDVIGSIPIVYFFSPFQFSLNFNLGRWCEWFSPQSAKLLNAGSSPVLPSNTIVKDRDTSKTTNLKLSFIGSNPIASKIVWQSG